MFLVEKEESLLQNNHTLLSHLLLIPQITVFLLSSPPQQSQYWSGVFKHFRSINTTRTHLKKRGNFWIVWLERKRGSLRWSKEKIWETSWNSVLPESTSSTNQSCHLQPLCLHHVRTSKKVAVCQPCGRRWVLTRNPTVWAPWFWTSGLQNCEKINFYHLSHPVCGILYGSLC